MLDREKAKRHATVCDSFDQLLPGSYRPGCFLTTLDMTTQLLVSAAPADLGLNGMATHLH